MINFVLLLSIVGSIFILFYSIWYLRGSLFALSSNNPWGILWYIDVLTILIPLIVVNYMGINNIPLFYMAQPGIELPVTFLVLLVLFSYITALGIFSRIFKLSYHRIHFEKPDIVLKRKIIQICIFLTLLGFALLILFHFLGYKHAFATSLFQNVSVLKIRLLNKYHSRVPSQLASMLPIVGYLLIVFSGYLKKNSLKYSLFFLFIAEFFLSAQGDKAPIIMGFFVWILTANKLSFLGIFSPKKFLVFSFYFIGVIFLLYYIVYFQIPDLTLDKFFSYLFFRLGVGQMAGLYETYSLFIMRYPLEGEFYWHAIPFSKLFVNYIDYQKFLMMITEGYEYSEMGVKNTLFIAEAYAIGGVPLALISPIILGFTYAAGLTLMIRLSRLGFGKNFRQVIVPVYIITNSIAGGFSGFFLFKGAILMALQLSVIFVLFYLFSLLNSKSFVIRIRRSVSVKR